MGRYTDAVCRLCRRSGEKLFLKGERCVSPHCAIERRRSPPGATATFRRRVSDRGVQLREKQKAKYIYGVLEAQFRKYVDEAFNRPGVTGQYLLQLLERRLDNVVFRLGLAESRAQARQLVRHGHIQVNGRKNNIPSYRVMVNDAISWKGSTKERQFFKDLTQDAPKRAVPGWLALEAQDLTAKVVRLPEPDDIESQFETRMIVEYYSR